MATTGTSLTSTSLTTYDSMLKEMYSSEEIKPLMYMRNPFFAMIEKDTGWVGDNYVQPLFYGPTNRRSANFGIAAGQTAVSVAGTSTYLTGTAGLVKATYTGVSDYATALLGRETMMRSKGTGAFADHMMTERKAVVNALERSICPAMYRDSTGWIGRIYSVDSTVITLYPGEAKNFEVGMAINVAASATGTLRDTHEVVIVSDVDYTANTITTATAISNISGATTGDYIFQAGDKAATKISGLEKHIPDTANLSTNFFGVDQTTNRTRLAGVFKDYSSGGPPSVSDMVIELAGLIGENGGNPTKLFISWKTWINLAQELQTSKIYMSRDRVNTDTAGISFAGIQVAGGNSPIDVIADHNCPDQYMYMLDMSTWMLLSVGEVPHLFTDDGILARSATLDAYELRMGYYAQLVCSAPGFNGKIKLSA